MIVTTPAIVLSTLRYGETSKIVRLATPEHGVLSAIAKGASRPRSRFGAALQVLSIGQAHLLLSSRRDLHTLTGFELVSLPIRLTAEVARYAAAAAMAELVIAVTPAEPNPGIFSALVQHFAALETSSGEQAPATALRAFWTLIGALGFAPALESCAVEGSPVAVGGPVAFSATEGGVVCGRCAPGRDVFRLPAEAHAGLLALVDTAAPLPELALRHAAAHCRLLARYVRIHVAEGARLPALEFWEAIARDIA